MAYAGSDDLVVAFLRFIPANLRPSPFNLIDPIHEAVSAGWDPMDLAVACLADNPRQPGHLVTTLRRTASTPPPPKRQSDTRRASHVPCPDATHEVGCQVCYCEGVTKHVIPMPMPEWFKQAWAENFTGWGEIPDD